MKRIVTLLASLALVAGGLHIVPAAAGEEEATVVPDVVQIEDPLNDANFLNDQDQAPNGQGDTVTPADAGSVSDLLKVWFSNTAEEVSAHILVEKAPPASTTLLYRIYTNPGEGAEGKSAKGCLRFLAIFGGKTQGQATSTYVGADYGAIDDFCNGTEEVVGKLKVEASGDNGIITITGPRSASPLLKDGLSLTQPYAVSKLVAGAEGQTYSSTATIDNTKVGTDYVITAAPGQPTKPAKPAKPAKPVKPTTPVKNGCDNGKGKKKGCKKTPKPKSCAAFTPGEMGKDAKTTVITDAATEDKPIEIDVPLGPATGSYGSDRTTRMKHNVQVDTTKTDAGLFARLESPALDDPDLYVYWPGGSEAAVAGGFNPLLAAGPLPEAHPVLAALNGTGKGGHSEFTAEQIDGLRTSDCQGWTLDLVNWAGRGGDYKLTLWLGEAQNEPAEEK